MIYSEVDKAKLLAIANNKVTSIKTKFIGALFLVFLAIDILLIFSEYAHIEGLSNHTMLTIGLYFFSFLNERLNAIMTLLNASENLGYEKLKAD